MNLEHEKDMVWLDDRSKYPYLREAPNYPIRGRTKRPSKGDVPGKLIAYATLKPTAKADSPGMFVRRLFYVAAHDPYPAGGPVEAVDPYTVHPGIPAAWIEDHPVRWLKWQRAARSTTA